MDYAALKDLSVELPQAVRLQQLVSSLRREFRCGAVALLRLEGDSLRPVATEGLVQDALGRRFELGQHPRLAAIAASSEPVCFEPDINLPDPYDGLLQEHVGEPLPVHDCMGVSLYIENQLWGLLTLDALHAGTFDERSKVLLSRYRLLVEATVRVTQLEQERLSLRLARSEDSYSYTPQEDNEILGHSRAIQNVLHELDVVADSELPVLLLGETGVGKELFARRLHQRSRRRDQVLVHVNCAALPESLAESELFGHLKGAFSGAMEDRAGRFEAANGGTIFLDEVGELPLSVQAKLLRTLQNGEIQRLGSDHPHKVDVRIIAATNRHLQDNVREGNFRADLYHRLSVYPLPIPPLRERGNDVLLLAGYFLELNRSRLGLRSLRLDASAEQALCHYHWPGNVRELEHVISRAALKAASDSGARNQIITIGAHWLDLELNVPISSGAPTAIEKSANPETPVTALREQVDATQREAIRHALDLRQGNWAAAARSLQINPSNLHKLAKRLGLKA